MDFPISLVDQIYSSLPLSFVHPLGTLSSHCTHLSVIYVSLFSIEQHLKRVNEQGNFTEYKDHSLYTFIYICY
uniref:Uncharacterized protein n=1 Tax=Tetranychus urticae TaxID=32264 RepID=T1KBW6_TETUR